MTDLHDPELDHAIRRAVAELTAAAPIARSFAELEGLTETPMHTGSPRLRWVTAGVLVAAMMAAAITIWRVGRDQSDGVVTIATDPPVTETTAVTAGPADAPDTLATSVPFWIPAHPPAGYRLAAAEPWVSPPAPLNYTQQLFASTPSYVQGGAMVAVTVEQAEGELPRPGESDVARIQGADATIQQTDVPPTYSEDSEASWGVEWSANGMVVTVAAHRIGRSTLVKFLDHLVWLDDPRLGFDPASALPSLPFRDTALDTNPFVGGVTLTYVPVGATLEAADSITVSTGPDVLLERVWVDDVRRIPGGVARATAADPSVASALLDDLTQVGLADVLEMRRQGQDELAALNQALAVQERVTVGAMKVETRGEVPDTVAVFCLVAGVDEACAEPNGTDHHSTFVVLAGTPYFIGRSPAGVDPNFAAGGRPRLTATTAVVGDEVWWFAAVDSSADQPVAAISDPTIGFEGPACCFTGVDTLSEALAEPGGDRAHPDGFTVESSSLTQLDVTANDTAPVSSIRLAAEPMAGRATVVGTSLAYTAPAGYIGEDWLAYTITDSNGVESTAIVSLQVVAASD